MADGVGVVCTAPVDANTRLAAFARRAGIALGAAAAAATASLGLIVRSTAESAAQIRQFAQVANACQSACKTDPLSASKIDPLCCVEIRA